MQEKLTKVNGLTVRYWESGTEHGRALVLLHGGWMDAQRSWSGVMRSLATSEHHVIAPDLPGFGKSDALPSLEVTGLLDWLNGFLDALEIESAVMVGSSFSALFVRLFAAAYPTRVPALILVNGGTIPSIPPALRMLARLPVVGSLLFGFTGRSALSSKTIERMVYDKNILTSDLTAAISSNTGNFARWLRMIAAHPLPEKRTPPVPTLLIWGANDQEVTLEEGKRIQARIPGSKLSEIESCGHLPQLEAPEVFVWQVSNFLQELSRPRKLRGAGQLPDPPPTDSTP